MIQIFPMTLFKIMLLLFACEAVFILFKKARIADGFNILGILACLTGLIYIIFITRRPPLFGPFETSLYIIFVLNVLQKVYRQKTFSLLWKTRYLLITSIIILLILILQLGKPIVISENFFMYDNIWVILFFNLRLLSVAFFAHAMILYLTCFSEGREESDIITRSARVNLLVGTFIYLISEWSGSLWCLSWFGECWRWSHGFFKSTMLFLLVMLVCHMPQLSGKKKLLKITFGILPGCFALGMIIYH